MAAEVQMTKPLFNKINESVDENSPLGICMYDAYYDKPLKRHIIKINNMEAVEQLDKEVIEITRNDELIRDSKIWGGLKELFRQTGVAREVAQGVPYWYRHRKTRYQFTQTLKSALESKVDS